MSREHISYEDGRVYEFSTAMEAVYEAEDGEQLTIETVDSLEGEIQTDDDLLTEIPDEVNAATGPISVAGATPGDVLAVEIEAIRLTEEAGRVITTPGFGLLQDHDDIDHPATEITPIEDGGETVTFKEFELPVEPVIGTIGVATAGETFSTLVPHDHGGNMDTTDVTTGNTIYFPVFQEGAMLAMGDCKAVMADGEMCGTGVEIGTEIDVTVSVVSDPEFSLERPLLDTGDAIKTVASAETLEEASKIAHEDALELLSHEHDLTLTEAYHFASLTGGLEISQVVDPLVTVRNAVPSAYLSVPFE